MGLIRRNLIIIDLILRSVFLLFFFSGCAIIQEAAVEDRERIIKDPIVGELPDTFSIQAMRSMIQSDKEAILAGSLTMKDGAYSLSISEDMADSLGIDPMLYEKYAGIVESLNKKKK